MLTRQQQITLAQVHEKRNQASRAVKEHMRKALAASMNEHLYEAEMAKMRKATEDFATWSKCLESLQPA